MGKSFDVFHLAALTACLPLGSKVLARIDPSLNYTYTDHLLHAILSALCSKPVPYPWDKEDNGPLPEFGSMPVDEFEQWLKQDWTEKNGESISW